MNDQMEVKETDVYSTDPESATEVEEEAEEALSTQDEAFQKYSDFTITQRKKSSAGETSGSGTSSERSRKNTWDSMLSEFKKRNISHDQVRMMVLLFCFLIVYFLFSSMFLGSRRYGVGSETLDCTTVSSKKGSEIVECSTVDGFQVRVIESHGTSVLLEVTSGKVSSGSGFLYTVYTILKYSTYTLLGLTVANLFIADKGNKRLKLLKRKYFEISSEIQRIIQNRLQRSNDKMFDVGRNMNHQYSSDESDEEVVRSVHSDEYSSDEYD